MNSVTSWLRKGREGGLEILRDPVKEDYQRLATEHDSLQETNKRLKGYVELLEQEYNEGKVLDVFRRYSKMKGMIKRTAMHLKVSDISAPPPMCGKGKKGAGGLGAMGGLLQGTREFVKKAEQARRRDERIKQMSSEEMTKENRQLEEGIRDYKRRNNIITELIRNLENQYNGSKRFLPGQRYRVMKMMVKNLTKNELIRDTAS